jgi:hypothetical protein
MATRTKVGIKIDSPDNWNSVVLSLATTGGFIISHGSMNEVHICAPKMNQDTLVLEQTFLTYWIEKKMLPELYEAIVTQQEELNIHFEDTEELEKIAKERDEAAMVYYKKSKKKKKETKIVDDEPAPTDDPDSCEHEGD